RGLLRRMVVFRDDVCRTPWCDAPIKHADHVTPVAEGGETEWSNASGLCAACNYAKEHPGWKHKATADDLTVSTPTGEEFETATPPFVTKFSHPPPGPSSSSTENARDGVVDFPAPSPVEELFDKLVLRDTG
ncbi:MAG: HNH endonuclease, partial [Brevibacterium aurantiacum]